MGKAQIESQEYGGRGGGEVRLRLWFCLDWCNLPILMHEQERYPFFLVCLVRSTLPCRAIACIDGCVDESWHSHGGVYEGLMAQSFHTWISPCLSRLARCARRLIFVIVARQDTSCRATITKKSLLTGVLPCHNYKQESSHQICKTSK